MKIYGLNKTTLLDYPGRVAATIFLGGCNFRCPFCQNSSLVLNPSSQPELSVTEVLSFLKKRQGILEGVCVTGGEPTLSPDLPEFLAEIRALGYPVKLDTNGTRPDLLKELAGEGWFQMAAVDIKACPDNYPSLCGLLHPDLDAIKETVDFLINGTLDYEFRTTVVKSFIPNRILSLSENGFPGAKAYYLQAYRDSEEVLQPGFSSFSYKDLEHFRQILMQTIPLVELRGID